MLSGATVVPYLAVSFAVYDTLKEQLPDDRQSRAAAWYPLAKIGMGATAGVVAQVPLSLHRFSCRVLLGDLHYNNTAHRQCKACATGSVSANSVDPTPMRHHRIMEVSLQRVAKGLHVSPDHRLRGAPTAGCRNVG